MLLRPTAVYLFALRAIAVVREKYPVADEKYFARLLVCVSFQESCIAKTAAGFECFDTEAKAKTTTATGLMQVLKGTQRAIEKFMGWPNRPLDDRKDPQYALMLGAAYLGYLYNRKSNGKDWTRTIASYHDGHYKGSNSPGAKYAGLVLGHYAKFDWVKIEAEAAGIDPMFAGLLWGARVEFK